MICWWKTFINQNVIDSVRVCVDAKFLEWYIELQNIWGSMDIIPSTRGGEYPYESKTECGVCIFFTEHGVKNLYTLC